MFRAQDDSPFQQWQRRQTGGSIAPMGQGSGGLAQATPEEQQQFEAQVPPPQQQVGGFQGAAQAAGQLAGQQQALQKAVAGQAYKPLSELDTSQFKLRGGGSGGVGSGALSGASMGASLGNVVPGIGTAIGAGIGALGGAIAGAFKKKAKSAATDLNVNDARNVIGGALQEFEGRQPNEGEIDQILQGQGWKPGGQWIGQKNLQGVLTNLQKNGEIIKQQKAAQQAAAPAAAPEAAAVAQAVAGPPAGGRSGILEGFAADKMNMGMDKQMKSPKYAFAAVAQKYDQSDPAQRQAMMAELKNHPSGFFKNAQLTGNKGDILDVGEQTDPVWGGIRQFDVIRAAGEGGKAWQWGARGGDSGGGASGGGGGFNPNMYPNASGYDASGDPVLAAVNGQSLNPVVAGMDRLRKLLGEIPGGINGIAGGGL